MPLPQGFISYYSSKGNKIKLTKLIPNEETKGEAPKSRVCKIRQSLLWLTQTILDFFIFQN